MAWTQADVDKLDTVYKAGHKAVTFGGRSVTLNSIDEYLKLRSLMLQEINAAAGTPKNYRLGATSKGA